MSYNEGNSKEMLMMEQFVLDKETKGKIRNTLKRMDDDLRELEEIQKEMDNYLYDIEKRIERLRRSGRA